MYSRQVEVLNATGLHARPAARFVRAAKQFSSTIEIRKTESSQGVNAKSIARLLTEAISQGTVVEISAVGTDEQEAVDHLVELIGSFDY